jgi:hypothetical protein
MFILYENIPPEELIVTPHIQIAYYEASSGTLIGQARNADVYKLTSSTP